MTSMTANAVPAPHGGEGRIDDLREPRRGRDDQRLFDFAPGMEVALDPDALVEEARAGTGMPSFGDETLLGRLRAQVTAIEADRALSGLGRFIVRNRLLGLL